VFTDRSAGKKTKADFTAAWTRKAQWLSSEDAIAWGVADEIA
jgi:ATP-dependent protease ClpP protease subunit